MNVALTTDLRIEDDKLWLELTCALALEQWHKPAQVLEVQRVAVGGNVVFMPQHGAVQTDLWRATHKLSQAGALGHTTLRRANTISITAAS